MTAQCQEIMLCALLSTANPGTALLINDLWISFLFMHTALKHYIQLFQ